MDGAAASASVAAVGLVKNEADIIGSTLRHLYRIGIRRFVIADNGSTDATPEIVRRFAADHADVTLVPLHDPVPQNLQWRKVTAMAHFAHHYFGVDYIYPFDADEFLVPPSALSGARTQDADIGDLIAGRTGWDYLELGWVTCVEPQAGERLTICGRRSPLNKLLVRWRADLVISQGNHAVEAPARGRWWSPAPRAPRRARTSWRVLHLPVRSAAQLRDKIIRSATANCDNPRNWGIQSRSLHEAWLREGDAVFDTLYGLIANPASGRQDLDRFARRFGVEPASLCYFQDFFKPRAPIAFRLPTA